MDKEEVISPEACKETSAPTSHSKKGETYSMAGVFEGVWKFRWLVIGVLDEILVAMLL